MWHHKEGIFIQIVPSDDLLKGYVHDVGEDSVLDMLENIQRCFLYHLVFSLCHEAA